METKKKIIIDTDIGDDIDDAIALFAAMRQEFDILGITTVFRNTTERARIAKKLLALYANGYEKSGVEISECDECGAHSEKTVKPLFKFSGYSVPEDGRGEIAIGYELNKEAIAAYEKVTGYKLSYGIFAALESIGTKDIFDANSGAITSTVASDVVGFDFRMTGIETAEYKALNMAMGAYVIADNGTEQKVSYMQGGKPEAEAKYIFVSYDLIASNS